MIRLLIADDELIERKVLHKTLKENLRGRCEVFEAENGREALEIYKREQIQIAIFDIEMPGINGIEAAQKIREMDKYCCIIFLTAFDEFAYAKKAITVRALDYLLKPYDEQELILVVEEAMRITEAYENLKKGGSTGLTSTAPDEDAAAQELSPENPAAPKEPGMLEAAGAQEPKDPENIRMSKVVELITGYIQQNYMYDISMQDVARHMNYSEAYFCKLFKQCFNRNFTSYLMEYRMGEAKRLLEESTVNVKEVGRAVGYLDSNYFTKVFRRITGKSPTEYRAECRQS